MAGLALVLDYMRKTPTFSGRTIHSCGVFSAKLVASAAAASVAASTPFASRAFFSNGAARVAYCDAGVGFDEDYISSLRSEYINEYSTKHYNIEPKPLFSAFTWRNLAMMSLRSFLMFYLPLLEHHTKTEDENDNDCLEDNSEEDHQVDLVTPFKKSVKQIGRETAVVTTRRVLERVAVHQLSQRMAWKLLKDVSKSAARKAQRQMPSLVYICGVTKTTFRGHLLGVLASWFVQVGIDIWQFFKSKEEKDMFDRAKQVEVLGRKIYITSVRCGASLVFASIGAGVGATIFSPSIGQRIGCEVGHFTGPLIIAFCFEKVLHMEL